MEAVKKTKKMTQQWKNGLIATNADNVKKNVKTDHQVNQELVLYQNDYDDLIQWKEKRAAKLHNQSRMFFFIGLTVALLMVITAFEWKFTDSGVLVDLGTEQVDFDELQDIPQTLQVAPPPPPQNIVQQPVVVEVPDEVILEQIEINMDAEVTEDMIVENIEFSEAAPEEEVAEEIFLIVEDKPEPIGGMTAFYQYVGKNIKYPHEASVSNVEGRVFVQFVVNSQGQIADVKVIKGIGAGCDEEAARIITEAPNWKPGKQRGRPVSVRMVIPITFKLATR